MPYNTRRKSLSLPSLGIHVPVTHAARAAAAAANRASASPLSITTSARTSSRNNSRANSPASSMASPASFTREKEDSSHAPAARPSKKLKRAHTDDSDDRTSSSEPLHKKRDDTIKFDNTPPPSPRAEQPSVEMDDDNDDASPSVPRTIDLEGINDEIVEAVIVQLQNTANRPHLVKELAAVLMLQLKIVQQSANPCAIISSRLATYLKRSCWSALAPCPLAKELESVHPRRTYFYLTTCPHLPLPDPAQTAALAQQLAIASHSHSHSHTTLARSRAIISPSLSSAASGSESDAADMDRRRELSPSPEVDLSSPELDDMDDDVAMPTTPIGSLSLRGFGGHHQHPHHLLHPHHHHHHLHALGTSAMQGGRNHRSASPPLEKDEREFTQTADGLQKRKLSGDMLSGSATAAAAAAAGAASKDAANVVGGVSGAEMMEYSCAKDDNGLFGEKMPHLASGLQSSINFMASPTMRPATSSALMSSLGGLGMSSSGLNFNRKETSEAESWLKLDNMLEWDRSPENIELDELDCLLDDY
ncbi:hypothetical protein B0T17DRAFT_606444 [Bombardia bombarda]|uniref:GDS1 winged helix domain-containing protein n=1 Tax=Bombardia bombarda TaxID=252184 RepID=A0AA40C8K5_9PEZI|nr:hypothetical protein B0T17DRAFT_606444 [Bombardia bombarda]